MKTEICWTFNKIGVLLSIVNAVLSGKSHGWPRYARGQKPRPLCSLNGNLIAPQYLSNVLPKSNIMLHISHGKSLRWLGCGLWFIVLHVVQRSLVAMILCLSACLLCFPLVCSAVRLSALLSACLLCYPLVCPAVRLSALLSACLPRCPLVCPAVRFSALLSACLPCCPLVCPAVRLSALLSACLPCCPLFWTSEALDGFWRTWYQHYAIWCQSQFARQNFVQSVKKELADSRTCEKYSSAGVHRFFQKSRGYFKTVGTRLTRCTGHAEDPTNIRRHRKKCSHPGYVHSCNIVTTEMW
jgi:hypothetical protein